MITKFHNPYRVVSICEDKYLTQVITKQLDKLCRGTNFPNLEFDILHYEYLEDLCKELPDDVNLLLYYYPLSLPENHVYDFKEKLEKIKEKYSDSEFVLISDKDISEDNNLFSLGVNEYIKVGEDFANRLWSVAENKIKLVSKPEDFTSNISK